MLSCSRLYERLNLARVGRPYSIVSFWRLRNDWGIKLVEVRPCGDGAVDKDL